MTTSRWPPATENTVRIWNTTTGLLVGTLVSTTDGNLAYTPGGVADGDFEAINSFLRWIAPSPEGPLAYRAKHVPHLVNKGLVAKALARS
jgi:hypothetical protein